MVEVDGQPILTNCIEQLAELGADEFVVIVGWLKKEIIDHYGDEYKQMPIMYSHQHEQKGLAHALLTINEHVDDEFILMLGDNVFRGRV